MTAENTTAETPTDNPSSIKSRFPLPALSRLVDILYQDALPPPRDPMDRKPDYEEAKWDDTLRNFGCACGYFRESIWRRRLKFIVINLKEDFSKLGECIRAEHRAHIRVVAVPPPPPPFPVMPQFPPVIGRKLARKLNTFVGSCPSLIKLSFKATGAPGFDGPSLHHPSLQDLEIGYPMLAVHTPLPLAKAFPNISRLTLIEKQAGLANVEGFMPFFETLDPVDYIDRVLGGTLPSVRELNVELFLPNEVNLHGWDKGASSLPLIQLLKACPAAQILSAQIEPPYTREQSRACMLPQLIDVIALAKSPLQRLEIQSVNFNVCRYNTIFDKPNRLPWTHLSRPLPTSNRLKELLAIARSRGTQLHSLSFQHIEKFHEGNLTMVDFAVEMNPFDSSLLNGSGSDFDIRLTCNLVMDKAIDLINSSILPTRDSLGANRARQLANATRVCITREALLQAEGIEPDEGRAGQGNGQVDSEAKM